MLADADLFGLDYAEIEEAAKELYIRALKILPPDIKRGFDAARPRRGRRHRARRSSAP